VCWQATLQGSATHERLHDCGCALCCEIDALSLRVLATLLLQQRLAFDVALCALLTES
jgi:hypothetical protein